MTHYRGWASGGGRGGVDGGDGVGGGGGWAAGGGLRLPLKQKQICCVFSR